MVELKVQGAENLSSTLDKGADKLGDLHDGFTKAEQIISSGSAHAAPRRTGRLASSVAGTYAGKNLAQITSPLVYAIPIHWGRQAHSIAANPFIVRTMNATESQWCAAIEADAQKVCDGVKGA